MQHFYFYPLGHEQPWKVFGREIIWLQLILSLTETMMNIFLWYSWDLWLLEISLLSSSASWVIAMQTGQDQSLYLRPKRRKWSRFPSPLWLKKVMVETRLLGNRSCYREKDTNFRQNGQCIRYWDEGRFRSEIDIQTLFLLLCWLTVVKWPCQLHLHNVTPFLKKYWWFLVLLQCLEKNF